ncbi:MAG: isocitrate/isopropylmalate dehydrogenase family protein [Firmicutes bacterium]|nr:isocitrate/isopropylmalate dehydrogenase family protein [Bacillota bacterium]
MNNNINKEYLKMFEQLIKEQLERAERLKTGSEFTDYTSASKIVVGIIPGDGIGPVIMNETVKVLNVLLTDEIKSGRIELRPIEGLTLENRVAKGETVPSDVLAAIKGCDVLLKGPTTTPDKNSGLPNLESANVTLRKELDLFANVRPVSIPELGIDWTFYRENTEGEYSLGSKGIVISDDLSVDFKVTTMAGTERIARAAFEFAKANGKTRVSIVTKANIMKKTDGKFLDLCYNTAKDYPGIKTDDWYVDIMAANLVNEDIRAGFQVFVLPNLYGDIITDEAAQIQGGVGTAGSANVGAKYAMFEAIHGSAPRMVADGIADKANPASIMKAAVMLLRHIGMTEKADKLDIAVNTAANALNMSGTADGNSAREFSEIVLKSI